MSEALPKSSLGASEPSSAPVLRVVGDDEAPPDTSELEKKAEMVRRLTELEAMMLSQIKGQEHVVPRVASVLKRGELGLTNEDRPRGSFLFLGPTGVGKTEITILFTRFLFGDNSFFRFDMSEFQHKDAVKQMIGDETGSVGRLGKILRAHTCGTLLFDEMEKAHKDILDLFLQILDAGRITTGDGVTHNLSNFYIVLTSNVGAKNIMRSSKMPFALVEKAVMSVLSSELRPEFVARINEKVVFKKLTYEVQREIAELTLAKEIKRLAKRGYVLDPHPDVLELLIRKGIDKLMGARPLRNCVEKEIQDAIVRSILENRPTSGKLFVRVEDTRQYLVIGEPEEAPDPMPPAPSSAEDDEAEPISPPSPVDESSTDAPPAAEKVVPLPKRGLRGITDPLASEISGQLF